MSILQRIATLTKAALHEGLNKLENPVLLTGQYLRDLEDEIAAAERNEHDLKVAGKVLERRKQEYTLLAARSEEEAVAAIAQGNEEAARLAVLAKLRYTESAQECVTGLEETRISLAALEANILAAKEERTRLKAKRAELAARARQATEAIHSAPRSCHRDSGLNTGSASRGFERMEDKITEWEVLAEQSGRTAGPGSYSSIDPTLSKAVDSELERLRTRKVDGNK
ncbi:PspA/IM30 family protein [Paenibacillus albidus]|uniref:PspA/IM30 family protein n=1 Tax=Paenibacillus albidus TaxID=2041023 RepID=UPI001BE5A6F8|nr:PspA/IM30 family protein [Paenibacillus albidus]MBT2289716.1 PspA/IM30 family protein [Paenibacillus albidus]